MPYQLKSWGRITGTFGINWTVNYQQKWVTGGKKTYLWNGCDWCSLNVIEAQFQRQ